MPAWINQYRLGFSNQTMTEKQKVAIEKKYGFEWIKSKVPFRFSESYYHCNWKLLQKSNLRHGHKKISLKKYFSLN